jgi:hypothetical protein
VWSPAVVLSPDRRKLYIVHADAERLTTADLTAHTVSALEIKPEQAWWERLLGLTPVVAEAKGAENGATKQAVVSPDGSQLYVLGRAMTSTRDSHGDIQTSPAALSLQVIDLESGRKLVDRNGEPNGSDAWINIRLDGMHVLLQGIDGGTWWMEALDAQSLKSVGVPRLTGWEVVPARRIDGQSILLARQDDQTIQAETQLAVLDPKAFSILHDWSVSGYAWWVTRP